MSTEAARGINSNSVEIAKFGDLELYKAQFLHMAEEYVKASKDGEFSADEMLSSIKDRLGYDDKFIMLWYKVHGSPVGFMCADVRGTAAHIIYAYLPPKLTNTSIIDDAMAIFDNWSRSQKCTRQQFYTFRPPNVHRFMLKKGWTHYVSVYTKEM